MHRHLIELDAAIVYIDGSSWFVIIATYDYGSAEAKHIASNAISKLVERYKNVVTGIKIPGGSYSLACSLELEEKIKSRIGPDHVWKRFRIDSEKEADLE